MADATQGKSAAARKVRKAVLPAAGLGTRFLPATKAQPKEMLTVVDKPQIQYVVEECVVSGIEHIIIVIGENRSFDHVYATYVPQGGESVLNLLSEGIVQTNGSPGPNYAKAAQFSAVESGGIIGNVCSHCVRLAREIPETELG